MGSRFSFLERVPEIHPVSLRFRDATTERAFQHSYFRDNLTAIRLAHVLGVIAWASFAFLVLEVAEDGVEVDLFLRFGVAIPIILVGIGWSFLSSYQRRWEWIVSFVLLSNAVVWSVDYVSLQGIPRDLGSGGMMFILAFIYVLARLRFAPASVVGVLSLTAFNVLAVLFTESTWIDMFISNYFLLGFLAVGMAASYGLERFARLLFLRERELDVERHRADDLLANALPLAVVDRLKERGVTPQTEILADGLREVSVVFLDMVDFTAHAQRIDPDALVRLLDGVFTRIDAVAARSGLEKIKTVGDAYMAAAGAPTPRPDHADAAVAMALGSIEALRDATWPSGEPVQMRVGIATGPVVAGVIGRRRFAYDLWGDTVNLASRLESAAQPGRVLVSEHTAGLLGAAFVVGEPCTVELKGKGPTLARFVEGWARPISAGSSGP